MKYPLIEPYSLKQKFDGQMSALRGMGFDVWFVSFDKEYVYINHANIQDKISKTIFGDKSFYMHTFAFVDVYRSIIKVLKNENFDYVYFRKYPIGYLGYKMCRKISDKNSKMVVEIPTYPEESERGKNIIRRVYSKYSSLCWKECNKYVKLFALIGKDSDNYKGYPAINIQNGIFVDNIPLREPLSDGKIHLLALASMCNWQGYDRIIQSLANYKGKDKDRIIIDMVGSDEDGSLYKWKQLANTLGVSDRVIFHGWKEGKALDEVFNYSTLGICGLGLYRKGFEKGSILKLREYTARGLPFVYAAEDPCVSTEMGYSLKVSNNDDPIDMARIVAFAKNVENQPDLGLKMREYAKKNISWEGQFEKILNII